MSFSLDKFYKFCSHVQINSKEFGVVRLAKLYGPQRWIATQIALGLEEDVHEFVILKCRQLGASTAFLCLDLYWPFTHPGVDGTIVTQDEKTFINFRTQLTEAYNSLPRTMKPFSPQHNRAEFVFRFPKTEKLPTGAISRIQYQVAGTREGGVGANLGRAKGNAFGHMTEVAFWGDQGSIDSLKNSFAEMNPMRLFVWESTANGFNQFEEMCRIAHKAVSQRFIFVSWWAHELYRIEKDDQRFKVYWGHLGRPTREERQMMRDVAQLYPDVMEFVNGTTEISPEQLAWYRWYQTEKAADPEMVQQEMPWTEHQAFVTTGAQYFSSRYLTDAHKRIVKEPQPTPFRVEIQQTLSDCKVYNCAPRAANLQVYAPPHEKGHYVLGADPAYGSSDWADRFVISVWRCWGDHIEQVAEYATPDCLPYAFAWVMIYLAGCYAPCGWNLEINGPGAAVLGEIESLKRQQFTGAEAERRQLRNFLGGMQEYFYTRFDAIQKTPQAKGTQSTLKEKKRYMDFFKGYVTREIAVPHSRELLTEMRWVTEEPGCAPGGSSRHKDDRVIAAALAVQMWHDKLRPRLMQANVSWMREMTTGSGEASPTMTVVQQMVARQVKLLGMQPPGTVPPRRQ